MSVQTALWRVSDKPERLASAMLSSEALLENMILSAPHLLSDEWMLIGKQEETGFGGRIDLLAIAPDASLVLIELKREKTPREVVAQSLDYASWVKTLRSEKIQAMYGRFKPGANLAKDFKLQYGADLQEEELNRTHQIVIVASAIDASTERIIDYLSAHKIPINVLFFQVFALGNEKLLSRTWLVDPATTQVNAAESSSGENEPWNGEFYCSFGADAERSWADAVRYGFVSAGGGSWYTRTLNLLSRGDRVWVKIPGQGFVGVGRITGAARLAKDFTIDTEAGSKTLSAVDRYGNYLKDFDDDPARAEYVVPVMWLNTLSAEKAFYEVGLFGNQNSVCKPTTPKWRHTVERLKSIFPDFDKKVIED